MQNEKRNGAQKEKRKKNKSNQKKVANQINNQNLLLFYYRCPHKMRKKTEST